MTARILRPALFLLAALGLWRFWVYCNVFDKPLPMGRSDKRR